MQLLSALQLIPS